MIFLITWKIITQFSKLGIFQRENRAEGRRTLSLNKFGIIWKVGHNWCYVILSNQCWESWRKLVIAGGLVYTPVGKFFVLSNKISFMQILLFSRLWLHLWLNRQNVVQYPLKLHGAPCHHPWHRHKLNIPATWIQIPSMILSIHQQAVLQWKVAQAISAIYRLRQVH